VICFLSGARLQKRDVELSPPQDSSMLELEEYRNSAKYAFRSQFYLNKVPSRNMISRRGGSTHETGDKLLHTFVDVVDRERW
jgi:hypothetical protein